ncbi:Calcineurin-like phosphoesterase superfamily domain protein [Variovorax sp. SRS16]|uniref:metallophosphoesterase n=1 Tax=Variovorax sp. SRS16 TaxID=282217 RepID=UPI0013187DBC|nr:metallophosphoesterase [Variovorax sp. SRS16]VTU28899.1 Calcineurin-like phosphoesterase superfamily domain protein [Variovorax sp. SRS16]
MVSHDVLHISDLHVESREQVDGLLGTLEVDLKHDLACERLRAIIVSGDVTNHATDAQYALALDLLRELRTAFEVPDDGMVVAPGNHDVSWAASKAALTRQRASRRSAAGLFFPDPQNAAFRYRADEVAYRERFAAYAAFQLAVSGVAFPLAYEDQFHIHVLEDAGLLVLTLNSAWNLNHVQDKDAGIHANGFDRAIKQLVRTPRYRELNKIAVWHHPLDSHGDDRIRDAAFARRLAQIGFGLALHGHTHEVRTQRLLYELADDGRVLHVMGAGSLGASARELPLATPWSYNLIRVTPQRATLVPRFRRSAKDPWEPYPVWQKNALERSTEYAVAFRPAAPAGGDASALIGTLAELKRYLAAENYSLDGHRIAVEAHLFDAQGRVLLQRRGELARDEVDRHEGIGGELGLRTDLLAALREEIADKLGPEVSVEIDKLLEVRPITFLERGHDRQSWYVVSYLGRLVSGAPRIMRPGLTRSLDFFTLQQIEEAAEGSLSASTVRAFSAYRARYGNVPYFERTDVR